MSNLHTKWKTCKDYGKDYAFKYFCGLLIIDQHRLLEEFKLGGKHQACFLKGKEKSNYRERVWFDTSTWKRGGLNQKPKGKIDAPQQSQKKKTFHNCGNTRHVEKVCYKKRKKL
jgi:hypothetical protein